MRNPRRKNRADFAVLLREKEAYYLHQIMSRIHKVDRKEQENIVWNILIEELGSKINEYKSDNLYHEMFGSLGAYYDSMFDPDLREQIKNTDYKKMKLKFIYVIFDQLQLTQELPREVKHKIEIDWNGTTVEEVLQKLNWDFDADYR